MGVAFPGRVLVTGAGGFIGGALCARFASSGVSHIAAVRALTPQIAQRPAYVAVGDFAATEWDEVLRGVDAIVHLAGRNYARDAEPDTPTPYIVANVHVTRRLAAAAARNGVRRIVFASSAKVFGETTQPGRPFRAGDPAAPQGPYAKTKLEAEFVLREICGEKGVEAVVLRLPLTYGPGVKGNFRVLLEAVAAERRLPLGGIVNRRSLLYLGNAISAIETALVAPALPSESLPVADAQSISTPELVTKLALALHVRPRLFHVPEPFLRGAAALLARHGAMARLLGSLEVDASRFSGLAGWSPSHTVDEGLAATAAWWRMRRAR
jgi:UDP-N-acetyl-alpha-D-quinovosamine dehydrogenase